MSFWFDKSRSKCCKRQKYVSSCVPVPSSDSDESNDVRRSRRDLLRHCCTTKVRVVGLGGYCIMSSKNAWSTVRSRSSGGTGKLRTGTSTVPGTTVGPYRHHAKKLSRANPNSSINFFDRWKNHITSTWLTVIRLVHSNTKKWEGSHKWCLHRRYGREEGAREYLARSWRMRLPPGMSWCLTSLPAILLPQKNVPIVAHTWKFTGHWLTSTVRICQDTP